MPSTYMTELPTELLEHILHCLPVKDILFGQQVCHRWNEVINSSEKLQQALFLIPEEPTEGWICTSLWRPHEDLGYRLDAIPPSRWQHRTSGVAVGKSDCRHLASEPAIVCTQVVVPRGRFNPLFFTGEDEDTVEERMQLFAHPGRTSYMLSHSPLLPLPTRYHSMLLTQPPVRDLNASLSFTYSQPPASVNQERIDENGRRIRVFRKSGGTDYIADYPAAIRGKKNITWGHLSGVLEQARPHDGGDWQAGHISGWGLGELFCPTAKEEDELVKLGANEFGLEKLSQAGKDEVMAMIIAGAGQ